MRTVPVRVGSDWHNPLWRRTRLYMKRGNLGITCHIKGRGFDLTHLPTGLDCHSRLQGLPLREARRAIVLLAALGDWDWDDPNGVINMPPAHNRSLWDAMVAISEMVSS